jgi:hypothetical protein
LKVLGANKPKHLTRLAKLGAKVTYALVRRTLVLILITLLRDCEFQKQIYLINDGSAKTLTTGRMMHSITNSPPAELSTQ